MNITRRVAAAGALVLLLVAGCGDEAVLSHWSDRAIEIDGDHADWEGKLTFVEDAKASIGLQNDGEFVYLAIATADRTARMQIMRGMSIWFDPALDKRETFGVRFPIVDVDPQHMRELMQSGGDVRAYMEQTAKDAMDSDWMEILGNSGMSQRLRIEDAHGIEAKLGTKNGALIYELKVPLQRGEVTGFSVEAEAGSSVQVHFESQQMQFEGGRGEGRPGGGPGGGGRGGRGGGTPGGGRPPSDFERPDPVDLWVTVQLASP